MISTYDQLFKNMCQYLTIYGTAYVPTYYTVLRATHRPPVHMPPMEWRRDQAVNIDIQSPPLFNVPYVISYKRMGILYIG